MIVISSDDAEQALRRAEPLDLRFRVHDDGDVYTTLNARDLPHAVPGSLVLLGQGRQQPVDAVGKADDVVRILGLRPAEFTPGGTSRLPLDRYLQLAGFVRAASLWEQRPVQCIQIRQELYSRFEGLYETETLSGKHVFLAGVGSMGSFAGIEMAKASVSHFELMDHDRLEVANVVRHLAGVSDIGRFKTKFLAQAIREKNPNAQVRTFQTKIEKSTAELVGQSIARSDLVICLTDNRKSRLIINDLCVRQNKPLILGGAFHRACGGQVLFVRPHVTPCYQCFVQGMPPQARDEEISSAAQARAVAYADRPVPIEPGLSTDIAPISLMVVKLAIQYLLRDQKTTLRSLDEDLVASWYLWINRRDPDTEYRDLEPLEFNLDGFRILRWYGIQLRRHPDCHACGTAPRRDGESAPSDDSGTPSASLLPGG